MSSYIFGGSKGNSYTFGSGVGSGYDAPRATGGGGVTARQALILALAAQKGHHHDFGHFLKGLGKGTLGGVGWTLDKLMRPSYAVSAYTDAMVQGRYSSAAGDALKGLEGKKRLGMGEVLSHAGVLKGHRRVRGGVGFGLDVLTDPLMLLSVVAAPETGGASLAAYTAARQAGERAVAKDIVEKATVEAGQAALKGDTSPITEELLKAGGPKYAERHALLQHNKALEAASIPIENPAKNTALHMLQGKARMESKIYDPHSLQFRIGTRKHGFGIARVPIVTRPGYKLSNMGFPIVSQLTDTAGRAFKPGFKDPIYHAGEIARRHASEYNAVVMGKHVKEIMGDTPKGMTEDEMLSALHLFEQPLKRGKGQWKAVVPIGGDSQLGFEINDKYVEHLTDQHLITPQQTEFVKKWHASMEDLFTMEKLAGSTSANFGHTGRLYVPHIAMKDGSDVIPTIRQAGLFTKAGFENNRKGATLSLLQIKQLVDKGELPNKVETEIGKLLARRIRSGAERTGDLALINSLISSVGIRTRIVDTAKLARATARLDAATAKHEAGLRGAAFAEMDYNASVINAKKALGEQHDIGQKALDKKILEKQKTIKSEWVAEEEAKLKRLRNPDRIKEQTKEINRLKRTALKHYTDNTVKALDRQKEKLQASHDRIMKGLNSPQSKIHKDLVGEHQAALKAAKEIQAEARDEMRKAQKSYARVKRGKRNKELNAGQHVVGNQALDEFGHPYAFPHEAAQSILRLQRFVSGDDATVRGFADGVRNVMRMWKILVTTVNPGYRIRNSMTDFWNMWVDGVPTWAVAKYGRQATKLMQDARKDFDPHHDLEFGPSQIIGDRGLTKQYEAKSKGKTVARLSIVQKDDGKWEVLNAVTVPSHKRRGIASRLFEQAKHEHPDLKHSTLLSDEGRLFAKNTGKKLRESEARRVFQEMADHGILSGLFAGDVQRQAERFTPKNALTGKEKNFMQIMNRNAENWGRITHYLYRRRNLGESASEAAHRVKIAHFDYEDLTPFEQEKMKAIFPFYTWTRKNIPYQVGQIFKHPGRYSAFPKIVNEATYAANQPDAPVPGYVSQGFGFALPFGKNNYYMPQFGVSDLMPLEGPGPALQRATSMVNPIVKTPAELLLNKSAFTGQPIKSDYSDRTPVGPIGAAILGMIPGSNVGATSRQASGTTEGANPYYSYIMSQVPLGRLAAQYGVPGKHNVMSTLGGQSVVTSDPALQASYDRADLEKQVQYTLRNLKDEGIYKPKKRKNSKFNKRVEDILKGNY